MSYASTALEEELGEDSPRYSIESGSRSNDHPLPRGVTRQENRFPEYAHELANLVCISRRQAADRTAVSVPTTAKFAKSG